MDHGQTAPRLITTHPLEFITLAGETVAIATLLPTQLRPIAKRDIAHVRELQTA